MDRPPSFDSLGADCTAACGERMADAGEQHPRQVLMWHHDLRGASMSCPTHAHCLVHSGCHFQQPSGHAFITSLEEPAAT